MIGTLISILFILIILGVGWWAVKRLLALIPLAEPFKTIVDIVLVLIAVCVVLYVLAMLLGMVGVRVPMALR